MKKVNEFGRFVRMKRMDQGKILIEMAESIGVSAPMLSMAELGRKRVPESWLGKITIFFSLEEYEVRKLKQAIEKSNFEFVDYNENPDETLEAAFLERSERNERAQQS